MECWRRFDIDGGRYGGQCRSLPLGTHAWWRVSGDGVEMSVRWCTPPDRSGEAHVDGRCCAHHDVIERLIGLVSHCVLWCCCCERPVHGVGGGRIVVRDTRSPAWDGIDTASVRPGDAVDGLGDVE